MTRALLACAAVLLLAPATASASTTYFTSASKNIGCVYSTRPWDNVVCDLRHVDHPKRAPASCHLDYGDSVALNPRGPASFRCHGDSVFVRHPRVLRYGKTLRLGSQFKCRVRKTTGMRCVSRTGHGFRVSRQHQKVW